MDQRNLVACHELAGQRQYHVPKSVFPGFGKEIEGIRRMRYMDERDVGRCGRSFHAASMRRVTSWAFWTKQRQSFLAGWGG